MFLAWFTGMKQSHRRVLIVAAAVVLATIAWLWRLPEHVESPQADRQTDPECRAWEPPLRGAERAAPPTDPSRAPGSAAAGHGLSGRPVGGERGKPSQPGSGAPIPAGAGPDGWSDKLREHETRSRQAARRRAAAEGWEGELDPGRPHDALLAIKGGRVYERMTFNRNAAISTAADRVRRTPPHDLDGGAVTVGVWDEGTVRATHREFGGRVNPKDGTDPQTHATHVAGTVAAEGVRVDAGGMAPAAQVDSYDWNYDYSEMSSAGMSVEGQTDKIQLSNHSYGFKAGWVGGTWYGTWGARESDAFGMYDEYARIMDSVCFSRPYLLPFKAAGNDRNDAAPAAGNEFLYYDNGWQSKPYDPDTDPLADGWDQGGYDTIAYDATAKNIMTVGSINDAVAEGARALSAATMTAYSSWGPTDDGRIKPDIVANGQNLLSCSASYDTSYITMFGTSMSAPNAAGSAALLVDGYARFYPGRNMRAGTLKGLIIHTADDLGEPGPDFKFGWGLMNTLAAADHLSAHYHGRTNSWRLVEDTLTSARQTRFYSFTWSRAGPIKVTLCWTDPPGQERYTLDDRTPLLVHDLDLRVISPGGATYFPFVLNVEAPADPAATGDNNVDNVEQVLIAEPAEDGIYRAEVTIEGALTTADQPYALLVTGSTLPPEIEHEGLLNTTNSAGPYVVEARITAEFDLDPSALQVVWSASGAVNASGTSPMTLVTNDLYRAEIPGRPLGTEISYYITAATFEGLSAAYPENAPETVVRFSVVEAVLLVVSGLPNKVPGAEPDYGVHRLARGIHITARAPAYGPPAAGARAICAGWTAYGSAPPQGAGNEVTFTLGGDTLLIWRWDTAYELSQAPSVGEAFATSTWWRAGTDAATIEAPWEIEINATNFAFAGWYLENRRLPASDAPAGNPAEGILMNGPARATAKYLPEALDADNDTMPDWWEIFHFGSTDTPPNMDADGDGFTNLKEFRDKSDPRNAGSIPEPPAIAHVPLGQTLSVPAPWTAAATVTDNDAVDEVLLQWSRNGGQWQSLAMTLGAEASVYTNAIPPPGASGDTFSYRIVARDRAGLMSVNGAYAFDVRYAIGVVNPAELGVIPLPRDVTVDIGVTVSNAGHAALDWALDVYDGGMWDNVEAGTNGWTHGGRQDVWHVSSRRAFSGIHSWYFGNESNGRYPDSADAWLLSPPIYLGPGAFFSFRQWLSTEALKDAEHAWDGCMVEVSTNDGVSFVQIEPEGGYPYVIYGHSQSAWSDGTPVFAGTGGWERVAFPLADYAGRFVRLRLRFGSDGYVVGEGWFVDDLAVEPWGEHRSWLDVSPAGGSLGSGRSDSIALSLSTHNIGLAGTRVAVLRFLSNDPVRPYLEIPVGLHNTSRLIVPTVSGNGSIEPPGPVFLELGDTTSFVISAEPYHHIASITTNSGAVPVPEGLAHTNFFWRGISFAGTGRLHAEFVPNRTSQGVPESWLVAYGLTNDTFDLESDADQDGDSFPTWQEYIAGTDPTNSASCLRVTRIDAAEGALALQWPSIYGRRYSLYAVTNLHADFGRVASNLPATPPVNTITNVPQRNKSGFYRVGVSFPE